MHKIKLKDSPVNEYNFLLYLIHANYKIHAYKL